jgi:hypothetical protein
VAVQEVGACCVRRLALKRAPLSVSSGVRSGHRWRADVLVCLACFSLAIALGSCFHERGWDYRAPGLANATDDVGRAWYRVDLPGVADVWLGTRASVFAMDLAVELRVENRATPGLTLDMRRVDVTDEIGTHFRDQEVPCTEEMTDPAGRTTGRLAPYRGPIIAIPPGTRAFLSCSFRSPAYPTSLTVVVEGLRHGGKALAPVEVRLTP